MRTKAESRMRSSRDLDKGMFCALVKVCVPEEQDPRTTYRCAARSLLTCLTAQLQYVPKHEAQHGDKAQAAMDKEEPDCVHSNHVERSYSYDLCFRAWRHLMLAVQSAATCTYGTFCDHP
ncbi:hypothetical protein FOMPIDRAFT_149784 [Fomitopsis schrenkii]|uniref:Uncharacterized protein n=1 Tax=Fomitopsis schrenkii TaxID=2126942 RepID=S8F4S2_FOMSC|nr:hypothetical protein FOMPIDRAFT_149784 [Fomitopsis schrenkii]